MTTLFHIVGIWCAASVPISFYLGFFIRINRP
jgi:hypothetical protein